jgi:hypothetical protein
MSEAADPIQLWIEALESGEYKQAVSYLSIHGLYCCLGVACEVAIKHGVEVTRAYRDEIVQYDGDHSLLPPSVQKWLGLRCNDGGFEVAHDDWIEEVNLATLNDEGATFQEIANVIRENAELMRW